MAQMATQRLFRYVLISVVFVSGLLTYLSLTSVRSWNVTNSWVLWSTFYTLSSSVSVPQPDGVIHDTHLFIRGPPGVAGEVRPRCLGMAKSDDADRDVCLPLLTGDNSSNTRPRSTDIAASEYAQRTDNCDCFWSSLGYFVSPDDVTDDERQFPIAFSLLTYENLEQTERLLRLIYRPHNVYCIHVDASSPAELHEGLEAIASCFDNVFVANPPIDIEWGRISVVRAELLCMQQLLDVHKRWKYFINLVARDFPLRTNDELVKILQAYDGANDVDGTRYEER